MYSENNYFNLIESIQSLGIYLCEGIEDMKKYYPNIDGDNFTKYIELDPTYKQGSDKAGQYAKWILGLANKNNGKLDRENHITDILTRFDKEKKQLKDKDIMKFKSVEDLDNYLNDDNNYNDLSHRQEVRQRQKDRHNVDLGKDAKLVYEDSDWEVWIPETYAASCKLGQGTSWCTASTETSEYFDSYNNDGPLYININKHDKDEKYQFHFPSKSFMDKDDEDINIEEFFLNNEKLFKEVYSQSYDFDIDTIKSQLDELKKNNYVYYYSGEEGVTGFIANMIKKAVVVDGTTHIGPEAFAFCYSLKSVEIPSSVTSISERAFFWCESLINVVIPDSVTSIGKSAFEYCTSLTSVEIPDTVTSIGNEAFCHCELLESIEIPNSVTSIGTEAFSHCYSLTSVTFGENSQLTRIESHMFYSCESLTSVEIPNSVTSIGDMAFFRCDSLTKVVIPSSVTSVGGHAFAHCDLLRVYCKATSEPVGWSGKWNSSNRPVYWGYQK